MIETITVWFSQVHAAVFEAAVLPLLGLLGLRNFMEDAFDFTEWFLVGLIEMAFLAAVILPLERWRPADRRAVQGPGDRARVDIAYTLLHRLGGFAILVFAVMQPLVLDLKDGLREWGLAGFNLDSALGLTYVPVLAALIYLLVLDFVDYWMHRFQHQWSWWWALHAVHHSQRRMTVWTDNRNHLLDDLIRDAVLAFVALLIGVAPAQFLGFVVITRVWQSVQHSNIAIAFPASLSRLLVSPGFHRVHHAVGLGHEGRAKGVNFAVLFPVWDWAFKTADWSGDQRLARGDALDPTGIRDQEHGVNYGNGFWQQQWIGLRHLAAAVARKPPSETTPAVSAER